MSSQNNESLFFENHECKALHKYRKTIIQQKFPALFSSGTEYCLSFWKYVDQEPTRFYSEQAGSNMYSLLCQFRDTYPTEFTGVLQEHCSLLALSFKTLNEVNELRLDKKEFGLHNYDSMLFIENVVNPAYLKLTEAVFSNLILPISIYSRIKRGAGLDGLKTSDRANELSRLHCVHLGNAYKKVVRNAIGHGNVHYNLWDVVYQDNKEKLELGYSEVIKLFDDMQDVCNGLALGLRLFYFSNMRFMREHGIRLPLFMMAEELQAQVNSSGWQIHGCLESEIQEGKQLHFFTKISLMDFNTFLYNSFLSATLAEKMTPGYYRYSVSFASKWIMGGCIFFYGKKMSEASNFNEFLLSLDTQSVLFLPKVKLPKFLYKVLCFWRIFYTRLTLPFSVWTGMQREINIIARYAKMHRNGFHSVIDGKVVFEVGKMPIDVAVRKYHKKLFYSAVKLASKNAGFIAIAPNLPIGYATIYVYSKNFRVRHLRNYGLGPALICVIKLNRLPRIKDKNILGGVSEQIGSFEIVWNAKPFVNSSE